MLDNIAIGPALPFQRPYQLLTAELACAYPAPFRFTIRTGHIGAATYFFRRNLTAWAKLELFFFLLNFCLRHRLIL